jgi:hypothetical protein
MELPQLLQQLRPSRVNDIIIVVDIEVLVKNPG